MLFAFSDACISPIKSNQRVLLQNSTHADNHPQPIGIIKALAAYFCNRTPVMVQVWAPGRKRNTFTLLWQKEVTAIQGDGQWEVVRTLQKNNDRIVCQPL